ncbi:MAG: serine protease [Bacteroidales bacterium]|nr:serine protease [Bacteroidales bacterium]
MSKLVKIILGLCLLISQTGIGQITTEPCDKINFTPISSKPSLESMLAGVKYALILYEPKIEGPNPAYSALFEILKAMGFESVEYMEEDYESPMHFCEEIWTFISFDFKLQNFSNIKWHFVSPCNTTYRWQLSSDKIVRDGLYDNLKFSFYNVFREMQQYKKDPFNSYFRIEPPKRQTCWTEAKFKSHILSNGCDKIEGIYENSASASQKAKYKVAIRKINGVYHLIYLSGAKNSGNWSEGEIKAILEQTATPNFYKAKWIMANKSENNEFYISFENGMMNVISPEGSKDLYIKLFPTSSDNIRNSPSELAGSGTGWAISSDGYIVTNYHVTEGAKSIKVRGVNGNFSKSYSAKVVVEDKNNDLAIIKIEDMGFSSLGTIPYVISPKSSDVGSSIFVLGYPLRATMGDEVKLTNGIISSRSGFQGDVTSYQMTAPVQLGNSGGPLFDNNGNIIGVINAKHAGAENASYAIKSSYLLNLIDIIPSPPKLQTISTVSGKPLTEQVKILKKFTYIIELNQ